MSAPPPPRRSKTGRNRGSSGRMPNFEPDQGASKTPLFVMCGLAVVTAVGVTFFAAMSGSGTPVGEDLAADQDVAPRGAAGAAMPPAAQRPAGFGGGNEFGVAGQAAGASDFGPGDEPPPPRVGAVTVTLTTNAAGAGLTLRLPADAVNGFSAETVWEGKFPRGGGDLEVPLAGGGFVDAVLTHSGVTRTFTELNVFDDAEFALDFTPDELVRLRVLASCRIGSDAAEETAPGFFLGDRRTVVTAASRLPGREPAWTCAAVGVADPLPLTLLYFDPLRDVAVLEVGEIGGAKEVEVSDGPVFRLGSASTNEGLLVLPRTESDGTPDGVAAPAVISGGFRSAGGEELEAGFDVGREFVGTAVSAPGSLEAHAVFGTRTQVGASGGAVPGATVRTAATPLAVLRPMLSVRETLSGYERADLARGVAVAFRREYSRLAARRAAAGMLHDAGLYRQIADEVVREYLRVIDQIMTAYPTVSPFRARKIDEARERFLRRDAARVAREVRNRLGPQFRGDWEGPLAIALADENLSGFVRDALRDIERRVRQLDDAAQEIGGKRRGRDEGRSAEGMLVWTEEQMARIAAEADEVLSATNPSVIGAVDANAAF